MKTVEYFEVSKRDGPLSYIMANFSSEQVAEEYAKGNGFYGGDAKVEPCTLLIADTIEEQITIDLD